VALLGVWLRTDLGVYAQPAKPNADELPELVLQTSYASGLFCKVMTAAHANLFIIQNLQEVSRKVCDAKTGLVERTIGAANSSKLFVNMPVTFALAPSGKLVADLQPIDGKIRLWDPRTGETYRTIPLVLPEEHTARAIAFDPTGEVLVVALANGTVETIRIADSVRRLLPGSLGSPASALTVSPDRRWLAAGSSESGAINVWDFQTGKAVVRFEHRPAAEKNFDFNDTMHLYPSVRRGSKIVKPEIKPAVAPHFKLVFDKTGQVLQAASLTNDVILIEAWATSTWTSARRNLIPADHEVFDFSPDGALFFVVQSHHSQSGTARLWQTHPWQSRPTVKFAGPPAAPVVAAAMGSNSTQLILLQASRGAGAYSPVVFLDLSTGYLTPAKSAAVETADGLSCSLDGSWLLTQTANGSRLWSTKTGYSHYRMPFEARNRTLIGKMTYSPSSQFVAGNFQALEGRNDSVKIFNLATNKESGSFPYQRIVRDYVHEPFAFSSDWGLLAVLQAGSSGTEIKVFDTQTQGLLGTAQPKPSSGKQKPKALLRAYAFWPGTPLLAMAEPATATTTRIRFWNPHTKADERVLQVSEPEITSLTFSPDGRWLVSATANTLGIWDLLGSTAPRVLKGGWRMRTASRPDSMWAVPTNTVAFRPNSSWFAASDSRGVIQLFDAATGQLQRTLAGHLGSVQDLAFTPPGNLLVSAGVDGLVNLWDLAADSPPGPLLRMVTFNDGNEWLVVTPDGLFDGSANALRMVGWRLQKGAGVTPLDALYNDFYRPGLYSDVVNGMRPRAHLDLATQLRVPGLRQLLAEGLARVQQVDGRPALCLKAEALGAGSLPVQLVGDDDGPWAQLQPGNGDCAWYLPLDAQLTKLLASPAAPGPPPPPWDKLDSATGSATLHVLTIAVDDYLPATAGFTPLPYSVASANDVRNVFTQLAKQPTTPYAAVRVWEPLQNADASQRAILQRFGQVASSVKPEDVVFVFLSGHGSVLPGEEMFYFIPADVRGLTAEGIRNTALSTAMLADLVRYLPARRIVLVIDACQSGGAIESLAKVGQAKAATQMRLTQGLSGQLQLGTGVYVIAAATPLQVVDQMQGGSALTKALLEGLSRPAGASAQGLADYVRARAPKIASETGSQFTPLIYSQGLNFSLLGLK
jgi:WD40 repeat protein